MKQWIMNLKIGNKLLIAFSLITILTILMGVIAIGNMSIMSKADNILYEKNTLGITHMGQADIKFQQIRIAYTKLVFDTEKNSIPSYKKEIDDRQVELEHNLDLYKGTIMDDDVKDQEGYNQLLEIWGEYHDLIEGTIVQLESNSDTNTDTIVNEAVKVSDELNDHFDDIMNYNITLANDISVSNEKIADNSTQVMLLIMIACVIFSVFIGLYLVMIISKPLRKMVVLADKLAMGDINVSSAFNRKDEIGDLDQALGKMVANIRTQAEIAELISQGDYTVDVEISSDVDVLGKALSKIVENNNELVYNIASASENVLFSAKQISDSSTMLSEGSTEQASSVEELTASLEEISSQTNINAKNAIKANELAVTTKEYALQGNRQMGDMLKSMEDINVASANIFRIIKVIDEIAFQTNILALNAAVEAARAGQHGKGFAVVAEEVKNLSARSANAAKETAEMIESSIHKTEIGTKIANETAEALKHIVERVEEVSTIINDIAVASNEQAQGVAQVNQGILQVSQVVQTNSSTSEENAAASEELTGQAEVLRDMVRQFKLKKSVSSKSNYDVNPQVFQMINSMSDRKKGKSQIILNSNEYGKY